MPSDTVLYGYNMGSTQVRGLSLSATLANVCLQWLFPGNRASSSGSRSASASSPQVQTHTISELQASHRVLSNSTTMPPRKLFNLSILSSLSPVDLWTPEGKVVFSPVKHQRPSCKWQFLHRGWINGSNLVLDSKLEETSQNINHKK